MRTVSVEPAASCGRSGVIESEIPSWPARPHVAHRSAAAMAQQEHGDDQDKYHHYHNDIEDDNHNIR